MKQTITIMILLCILCGCSATAHIRWGTIKCDKGEAVISENGVTVKTENFESTDPNSQIVGDIAEGLVKGAKKGLLK